MRRTNLISPTTRAFVALVGANAGQGAFSISGASATAFASGASFAIAGASEFYPTQSIGWFSMQGSSVFFPTQSIGAMQIAGSTTLNFVNPDKRFVIAGSTALDFKQGYIFAAAGATTVAAVNESPALVRVVSNSKSAADWTSTFSAMSRTAFGGKSVVKWQSTRGQGRFWVRPYPRIHFYNDQRSLRWECRSRVIFRS